MTCLKLEEEVLFSFLTSIILWVYIILVTVKELEKIYL